MAAIKQDKSLWAKLFPLKGWDPIDHNLVKESENTDVAMANLWPLTLLGYSDTQGYRVFTLATFAVMSVVVGVLIFYSEGGLGSKFWYTFLSYSLLAIGPAIFWITLCCCGPLWKYLSVTVPDSETNSQRAKGLTKSFPHDAERLLYGGLTVSIIFIVPKVVISFVKGFCLENFLIVFWTYLVLWYVYTAGLVFLGVRNLGIKVNSVKMVLQQGANVHVETLLTEVKQLNQSVERFSRKTSPFLISQIAIQAIIVTLVIALFTQTWHMGQSYLGPRGDSITFAILQITVSWSLMLNMLKFNGKVKALVALARENYMDLRKLSPIETSETQQLQFIEYCVRDRIEGINVFGRNVDSTLTDLLFPIQLAVGFFTGGSLATTVITQPPTTPKKKSD